MEIAVVGSGVSGLVSAYTLSKDHKVTVFEADSRAGGHANTITVEDPEAGHINVDTGFIVHNDQNYPELLKLFKELDVATQPSEMSFSVSAAEHNLYYRATNLKTLFAHKPNLTNPKMWSVLKQILRFNKVAKRYLNRNIETTNFTSTESFLKENKFTDTFIELYLIPLGASIWSANPDSFLEFPIHSLLSFLDNHGLLSIGNRPNWRTVTNGSKAYVDKIVSAIEKNGGQVLLNTPVKNLLRTPETKIAVSTNQEEYKFDAIVIACHSDQALNMIGDPTDTEFAVLSSIRYNQNNATLHTDTSVMPNNINNWASWNYLVADGTKAKLTYDLTRLQNLPGKETYLVSLNCKDELNQTKIIGSYDYTHPIFDAKAIEAQQRLAEINGRSGNQITNTFFCGAYWGYGFHEDGAASAIRTCEKLNSLI